MQPQEPLKFINHRRYQAAPTCPCGKSNRDGKFSPIQGMDKQYGKCHSCGKLFLPKSDKPKEEDWEKAPAQSQIPLSYIDDRIVNQTLKKFEENTFYTWLEKQQGRGKAVAALMQFNVGTAKGGRTIFWHIDEDDKVRTGRVFEYDAEGKRNKKFNQWAHSMLKLEGRFQHCLYGIHQLQLYSEEVSVMMCESSKNAIVGWCLHPELFWVGTDGATGLTNAKAESLAGRHIVLLPDADETGRQKSVKHNSEILDMYGCTVEVMDLMPEADDGTDIADIAAKKYEMGVEINDFGYPAAWD